MRQYKKRTSQLQEMQDQMNSTNDSGEFQEVESNYRERLSYVPSQLAIIPSSRSMLSRDKRLPLDTWNAFGVTIFLHLIHPEIILKEFTVVQHKGNDDQFHKQQGQMKLFSLEMTNKMEAQFQCRHLQEGR